MESAENESARTKMESLRFICETGIPNQQQKIDAFATSFNRSLESIRSRAKGTAEFQGKLEDAKAKLREAEDDMVKALAVKTRKEAKRMALVDAISSTKSKVAELRRNLQEKRAIKEEYAAILFQQSRALASYNGNSNQAIQHKDETQEAISWYNRVLGFYIEGGHGVKFSFRNMDLRNPEVEFYFTVRHTNDTYTLLNCEPSVEGIDDLIHDLNKTNGLFKFVRVMREKFRETLGQGNPLQLRSDHQESSVISLSAPVLSSSTHTSESPTGDIVDDVQSKEGDRHIKKLKHGMGVKGARTPVSVRKGARTPVSVRSSPRVVVKR